MHKRRDSQFNTLIIVLAVLAVAGGLAIVFITSPQSFALAQAALFQPSITRTPTVGPSPTASTTPTPVTATATRASAKPDGLPTETATATSTAAAPTPAAPRATGSATLPVLPADARGFAVVAGGAGAATVRVRDQPNGARLIAAVAGGTLLQVLWGRNVVANLEWLQVRLSNGQVGWVASFLVTITYERPGSAATLAALASPTAPAATASPAPAATATAAPANTNPPPATSQPSATATNTQAPPTATASETATETPAPIETATETLTPVPASDTPIPDTPTPP